jgi:hypothetical protein
VKWAERWIARAQRKADARDERYRRSLQAGEIPPGLFEGLAARRQAAFDQRRAQSRDQSRAILRRYPELASYAEASQLVPRHGESFRGPDGVEVSVWHAAGDPIWPGWPELPSRWHRSRKEWLFAMAGYCVSLPLKLLLLRSHEMYTARAETMSGPPVSVTRDFPTYGEAVLYAALLAKEVQAGGVEALRRHAYGSLDSPDAL